MKKSEKLMKKLSAIEVDICNSLEYELKRINRTFTEEDAEDIEFFTYSTIEDQNIESVNPDGTVSLLFGDNVSLRSMVNNGSIPWYDAVSLLQSIEEIK